MHRTLTADELRQSAREQMVEMDKHRWLQSEKAGRDLGEAAYHDWVDRYAAEWREDWFRRNPPLPANG